MSVISKIADFIAPRWAMEREKARLVSMHLRAARLGKRSDSLRPSRSDADRASRDRGQVAAYARDLIRNTPFALRYQAVVANNVVGDGIIPKVEVRGGVGDDQKKAIKAASLEMIEDLLDTTAIDVHGLANLYGLQRVAMNSIAESGEVLIRRHRRMAPGTTIMLQIEVLEPDFIDTSRWGPTEGGGEIREGIEYDWQDRRVAYWLFQQHPGGDAHLGRSAFVSERVPANDILHIFRLDRAGQTRGVSWLNAIAEKLMDLDDYADAQLMRQKIAACFAAFRRLGGTGLAAQVDLGRTLEPGMIMDIGPEDEMSFGTPPDVGGFDEFTASVLRAAAMGGGITYEALTGDLSGVNFSSARIGRVEMDRNVSAWQWLMMIPQMMQPLGGWILEAWRRAEGSLWQVDAKAVRFVWVPPVRILVDPAREFSALREAVRSGFQSRQGVVRQLGIDPERLLQEQLQDKEEADRLGLPFDSDPRADVSRQSRVDDPEDQISASMLAQLSAQLGVSAGEILGLIDDLRAQENRRGRK